MGAARSKSAFASLAAWQPRALSRQARPARGPSKLATDKPAGGLPREGDALCSTWGGVNSSACLAARQRRGRLRCLRR
jgi:hypothetical protein